MRYAAVDALVLALAAKRGQAADHLFARLGHVDRHVRYAAATALAYHKYNHKRVVEELHAGLADPDPVVKWRAVRSLVRLQCMDQTVLQTLLVLLRQADRELDSEDDNPIARLLLDRRDDLRGLGEVAIEELSTAFDAARGNGKQVLAASLAWLGRVDGRIMDVLLSAEPSSRQGAEAWLHAAGFPVIEPVVKFVEKSDPWTVLAACQRVLNREALSEQDDQALGKAVSVQDDDSPKQREARRWLATWLWSVLEPG
jgi:hypothetical protein